MRQKGVLSILLLLLALLTIGTGLDEDALGVHDASFERAIGAFAIAKGLNAVISVLQGTEFNATPAGLGVTITVGQVLDPMNDMIERFSWVMLAASVSLGIQRLLLSLGELLYLQLTLVSSIALLLTVLWYRPLQYPILMSTLLRIGIVLSLLRFAAMLFVYAQSLVYIAVMEPQYHSATQTLKSTQRRLEEIATHDELPIGIEKSWLETMQDSYDKVKRSMDITMRLDSLQILFEQAQKEIITLIAIFIVLTMLLPLLFVWVLLTLSRWAVAGDIKLIISTLKDK